MCFSLRGLRTPLQGRIRTERQRGDKDRLQAWRDWLDEAWSSKQGAVYKSKQGAVYKWLKGESFAPLVTFLVRPDGTPTANLREMDSLLQDAWRPINRKYAEAAEPDPAEFLRRYGRHVRCVPMISGPLTGRRLRRALMRMHPSALGLDGWSLEDVAPGVVGGPLAGGGTARAVAVAPRRGLHGPHPQRGPTGAAEHAAPNGPLHGLPPPGGDQVGGGHPLARGLGAPACLWFPPGAERPGWRHSDPGSPGAVPLEGVGGGGDEHRLRQVFRSHPKPSSCT